MRGYESRYACPFLQVLSYADKTNLAIGMGGEEWMAGRERESAAREEAEEQRGRGWDGRGARGGKGSGGGRMRRAGGCNLCY